jgi:hypothetical protein
MAMLPEHPDFDYLDFTWSTFGKPQIDETSIRVRVRKLSVGKGFPGHDQEKYYKEVTLVLEGVVRSERRLALYTLDGRELSGIVETIVDGPFAEVKEPVFDFPLGGFSHDPGASLMWDVVAASIRIEDGIEKVAKRRMGLADFGLRSYRHHDIFRSLAAVLNSVIKRGFQGK